MNHLRAFNLTTHYEVPLCLVQSRAKDIHRTLAMAQRQRATGTQSCRKTELKIHVVTGQKPANDRNGHRVTKAIKYLCRA